MRHDHGTLVLAAALLLAGTLGPAAAAPPPDWDQWRGPDRSAAVAGPAWPASLESIETRWSVPLGRGYAGPIVTADAIFVVETVDDESVAASALRPADGTTIWRTAWPATGKVPFFAKKNGDWVRSTPAWDGETLYVGDMTETLAALDGATGEIRWTVDFPARFGTKVPDFGFASSPLVDGDALYVQAANSIVKLDRATGKTIWRGLASSSEIRESGAFSSPVIAELDGVRQLVVLTRTALNGVALDDGRALWTQPVPNFRGMNILTPVVDGDRIFTSPYRNGSFLYEVSREGDAEGGELRASQRWAYKASGYMSSPVVHDGLVYMHLGNGRVSCIELATGTERWRSTESFGKYWSMVLRGDTILALDSDGELIVMRATPERFELLDRREVSEREAWAHLAVRGEMLYVRDLRALHALRLAGPASGAR